MFQDDYVGLRSYPPMSTHQYILKIISLSKHLWGEQIEFPRGQDRLIVRAELYQTHEQHTLQLQIPF